MPEPKYRVGQHVKVNIRMWNGHEAESIDPLWKTTTIEKVLSNGQYDTPIGRFIEEAIKPIDSNILDAQS